MKKGLLLKTMLLLCALVAGSTSVWADTLTEGFEKKATSTTYNGTVTVSTSESDCDIAWTIYYGTVSTNDKISGTRSAQMRWYSSATENIPYAKTTTAIEGLSNVALKARTSNLDVKMDVCYSANGSTWTVGKTHTFSAINTAENVSLDIPSGNKYVKFEVSSSSTAPGSGNYKLIVDDVTFTYSSDKETPTWSLSPASATVMEGETTDLVLTTNYDGTLSFESADTDIATVSYNSSTKVLTVTGVAAGTTTISATGDATSTYSAISKTIDVTVTHTELPYNVTDVMGPLGYSYYGLTPSGSDTYAQPEVASTTLTDAYGVTIVWAKAEGGTYPRYDAEYTRFYNGNTLTVTAPVGSYITKIVFTEPGSGKSWAGDMTANSGDYVSDSKTWYATSDVSSVVLTNSGTKRIGGMEVYLMRNYVPITITAAGWASFSNISEVAIPAGVTAYYASASTPSTVTLTEITGGYIPAGEGVVVSGSANTYNANVTTTGASLGGTNLLKANLTAQTLADTYYTLAVSGGDPIFKKSSGVGTLAAGKAYLDLTGLASELTVDFGGTTGVNEVKSQMNANGEVYNLNGQRVAQPTKGLYIVNGKKVVMK